MNIPRWHIWFFRRVVIPIPNHLGITFFHAAPFLKWHLRLVKSGTDQGSAFMTLLSCLLKSGDSGKAPDIEVAQLTIWTCQGFVLVRGDIWYDWVSILVVGVSFTAASVVALCAVFFIRAPAMCWQHWKQHQEEDRYHKGPSLVLYSRVPSMLALALSLTRTICLIIAYG